MNAPLKYQAMTQLPRHIEERLLTFNVMQLCALVSEKNGNRWTGASDRYGPIQEIARRWGVDDLFKRIADIPIEDDIVTYARIMTAAGGNPSLKDPPRQARPDPTVRRTDTSRRTMAGPNDPVAPGMAGCANVDDLKRIAAEQGLTAINWEKVETLVNFGLKRMYVGNAWRTKIRREAKQSDT